MLTAIRTEQEKRCELDQPYAGHFDKLGELVSSAAGSALAQNGNYSYQLGEKGVRALRSGKDYALSVPSYADGRLCCSGSYCEKLNKSYPLCETMTDVKTSPCSAPLCEVSKQCDPGETSSRACECGSQSRTCDNSCQWGPYSGSCYAKYGGTGRTRSCPSGCGTQVSVSTCSGESWSGSCWSPSGGGSESASCSSINASWEGTATRYCSATCSGSGSCGSWDTSGCSVKDPCAGKTCSGPSSQSCPSGYSGTQYRTCNCGVWSAWQGSCAPESKACSASSKPASEQPCGSCGQKQTRSVSCDTSTGVWKTGGWSSCPADPTCSGSSTQSCPSGQTGTQTRTCTCGKWSNWQGTCTPKPTCSDASYKASHKSECCPSTSTSDSVCWRSKTPVYVSQGKVITDVVHTNGLPNSCRDISIRYNGQSLGELSAGGCANGSCKCSSVGSLGYTGCSIYYTSGGLSSAVAQASITLYKCTAQSGYERNGW